MAPASSAAPRRVASSKSGAGAGAGADPGRGASRRQPLQVVPSRRANRAGSRILKYLPVIMVVLALLVVVAGQAMLANGQVRMADIDQRLQAAQGAHRQLVLNVSKQEVPTRIVGAAIGQLHMVRSSNQLQLPYVPTATPLATPNVTPAAAVPPPATTTPTTTTPTTTTPATTTSTVAQ
jgi:cell division septation protein DedD